MHVSTVNREIELVSLGVQSCVLWPETCVSNQNAFSALDITKVERAKVGKTIAMKM